MRSYEISKKAFDTPFPERSLRSFQPFEPVSRANFMPFLIRGLMDSRGSPLVHASLVRLEEEHVRFNAIKSLHNLLDWQPQNTWMKFNQFERGLFFAAYKSMVGKPTEGNPMATHLVARNKVVIHRDLSPTMLVKKFAKLIDVLANDLTENNLAFPVSRSMNYQEFEERRKIWLENEYIRSIHRYDEE